MKNKNTVNTQAKETVKATKTIIENPDVRILEKFGVTTGQQGYQTDQILSSIQNVDLAEIELLNKCLPVIEKCCNLFKTYSSVPYSDNNFLLFQKAYCNLIHQLENLTSSSELKNISKQIKHLYWGRTHEFTSQSLLINRAFSTPFGYPGDFVMLQYLYDNNRISATTIGQYCDQMFLMDPLSKAVINRVNTMSEKIRTFIDDFQGDEITILDIASGSGFDLIPIVKTQQSRPVTIYCLDQEVYSLAYIKNQIDCMNVNTNVKYVKGNIIKPFSSWNCSDIKFDLIYNIGLADYLPDRILHQLMQESINALNKEGKFIISHKDYEKFPSHINSWSTNWNFTHRSLDDYKQFIEKKLANFSSYDISFESKQQIIYFGEFLK